MSRAALRAAAAALAGACLACAGGPRATSGPSVVSSEIPAPTSFASPLEARATMLMLEDERRFDPGPIESAAGDADPEVRAAA
ncbi:MAG TPA: hypothetical protein VFL12_05275, partial [Thermoanaerobaculia bacterium]|nr:hypothetical protein [Thermoanaerobaculia bacterium]